MDGDCEDFEESDWPLAVFDAGSADVGVVVQASGETGPYTYTVLSVDHGADDPAQGAADWLMDNGYDVTGIGADLLRPTSRTGSTWWRSS